jgi:inorganic pyrophosphatase
VQHNFRPMLAAPSPLPNRVRVRVEVPRGSFLKREGPRIEYVSPLPCPFNYGSVVGTRGEDGDPLDAVVLGPGLPLGTEIDVDVHGVVAFLDDGCDDAKLVCGALPTAAEARLLRAFFAAYAPARALLNRLTGRTGPTRYGGLHLVRDGGLA